MANKLTDEEAIALAALHGCLFAGQDNTFWVHSGAGEYHQLELVKKSKPPYSSSWDTREELAHDYCEFYGLELTT